MERHRFRRVVVLTGAGISAESGIATFRAKDGLWERHRILDVATPDAFERDPKLVHRFYNARRAEHEGTLPESTPVQPNAAHVALAEFQKSFAGSFLLVTQNVDALHERGGSEGVLHMHGELLKVRCVVSGQIFPRTGDVGVETVCECCGGRGRLRPHIVWFGEMPLELSRIETALSRCDLFVAIGTSGNVYPAAGFFQIAKAAGAHTVELNLEPSLNAREFDETHCGPASQTVPAFFSQIAGGRR